MECELTNMIMIENPETDEVIVQNRVKYWTGITFPGGHIEKGESEIATAKREVLEETGLHIDIYDNFSYSGVCFWYNGIINHIKGVDFP